MSFSHQLPMSLLSQALLIFGVLQIQPSAEAHLRILSESNKAVEKGINSSWCCSKAIPDKGTEISFSVADDGKIYDPIITVFTNDNQYDAECLEAVCSLSPMAPPPEGGVSVMDHYHFRFGNLSDIKPGFDGSDIRKYLLANPQPQGDQEALRIMGHPRYVVIHKIPLTVLTRYPGMFKKEELVSPDNLIKVATVEYARDKNVETGIPPQPLWFRNVADIYAYWNELFKRSKVSKTEVLEYSKRIPILQ